MAFEESEGLTAIKLQVPGLEAFEAYESDAELENPLLRASGLVGLLLKSYQSELVLKPGVIELRLEVPG